MQLRLYPRPLRIEDEAGPPRYPVKEMLARVRTSIFHGDHVECPCCGMSFSHRLFSPYMTALCPRCLSIERYRLLCHYLRNETDFGRSGTRTLDIAPMWCFQEFCRTFGGMEYVSIDIESPYAMRHMDLRDLEFKDDHFDHVICYHVLEHIPEDDLAIAEIYRVMKPGAWAVIQVPILIERTAERSELTPEEQVRVLKFPDHVRAYGLDFKERLQGAGFEVEVDDYVKRLPPEELERYGLDVSEDLYICRK